MKIEKINGSETCQMINILETCLFNERGNRRTRKLETRIASARSGGSASLDGCRRWQSVVKLLGAEIRTERDSLRSCVCRRGKSHQIRHGGCSWKWTAVDSWFVFGLTAASVCLLLFVFAFIGHLNIVHYFGSQLTFLLLVLFVYKKYFTIIILIR